MQNGNGEPDVDTPQWKDRNLASTANVCASRPLMAAAPLRQPKGGGSQRGVVTVTDRPTGRGPSQHVQGAICCYYCGRRQPLARLIFGELQERAAGPDTLGTSLSPDVSAQASGAQASRRLVLNSSTDSPKSAEKLSSKSIASMPAPVFKLDKPDDQAGGYEPSEKTQGRRPARRGSTIPAQS